MRKRIIGKKKIKKKRKKERSLKKGGERKN